MDLYKDLKNLEKIYREARSICDPKDYEIRQRDLLYAACEFLLNFLRAENFSKKKKINLPKKK